MRQPTEIERNRYRDVVCVVAMCAERDRVGGKEERLRRRQKEEYEEVTGIV
jgi:hypothetical protein